MGNFKRRAKGGAQGSPSVGETVGTEPLQFPGRTRNYQELPPHLPPPPLDPPTLTEWLLCGPNSPLSAALFSKWQLFFRFISMATISFFGCRGVTNRSKSLLEELAKVHFWISLATEVFFVNHARIPSYSHIVRCIISLSLN